jgi:hypothetical protein
MMSRLQRVSRFPSGCNDPLFSQGISDVLWDFWDVRLSGSVYQLLKTVKTAIQNFFEFLNQKFSVFTWIY